MLETNEYFLKVSSKIAIEPKELELGQDVEIVIKGTVVKEERRDTQEGTMDKYYVVKPLEAELK